MDDNFVVAFLMMTPYLSISQVNSGWSVTASISASVAKASSTVGSTTTSATTLEDENYSWASFYSPSNVAPTFTCDSSKCYLDSATWCSDVAAQK